VPQPKWGQHTGSVSLKFMVPGKHPESSVCKAFVTAAAARCAGSLGGLAKKWRQSRPSTSQGAQHLRCDAHLALCPSPTATRKPQMLHEHALGQFRPWERKDALSSAKATETGARAHARGQPSHARQTERVNSKLCSLQFQDLLGGRGKS